VEILEIETEVADGLVRVALRGELDLSTVNKVEEELQALEADGARLIVLDLSRLSFLVLDRFALPRDRGPAPEG